MDIALVSATTALIAVVVGPLVAVYVGKKQIDSANISANRQHWINSLRNELAEFVKLVKLSAPARSVKIYDEKESWQQFEQLNLSLAKITLLLNPKEREHQELAELLCSAKDSTLAALRSGESRHADLAIAADAVVGKAQSILKSEWERVKRGT